MAQVPSMDKHIVRRLLQKKKRLDGYRPLDPRIVERLHGDLRLLATFHSNAIEGNTLTLQETHIVLEFGITVDGHSIREYLEAINHAEAFDLLPELVHGAITVETITKLHGLVMDKNDETAGQLRKVQVYIRGSELTPPRAADVPLYLHQWVKWLSSDQALLMDPVTRAAVAHHDFEALHPFQDGNGRVGRLLLNLMLMQDDYPPALILRDWRPRYIRSLQQGHYGNYDPLINLVGLAVEEALDLYLDACVEASKHLLPLRDLAPLFDTTTEYLSLLARTGKIDARKHGQSWHSTQDAIAQYFQAAREQPRGRPRKET